MAIDRTLDPAMSRTPTDGVLQITITYLEMHKRPGTEVRAPRLEHLAIFQARQPTVSFYRYLYNHVGEPWLWYERRALDDDALREIIHHPAVSIHVLYFDGVPAGYVELDGRIDQEVELAYFGLLPEFIGRGIGPWLLSWALATAWDRGPSRVWVNTNSLDHPKALLYYQRAGFVPYRQETIEIRDPRCSQEWQVGHSLRGAPPR